LCPAGSLAWASDQAGPTVFFLQKIKERERDLWFSGIFILRSEFFYVVKKISISYLEYLVFDAVWQIYIYIKKNIFLCVAYGQYPNMFWTLIFIQKILEVSKMCFRMDFLNTTKIIFLHFWILQHVCKTPKGIGQYSKKIKNLILEGIHLLFTVNVWMKKSQRDEYPKY